MVCESPALCGEIPSPRSNHGVCRLNDYQMIVFGGVNGQNLYKDVYLFTILKHWALNTHKHFWSYATVRKHMMTLICCLRFGKQQELPTELIWSLMAYFRFSDLLAGRTLL
eukprot:m.15575 g.15575  ORF g.15575 m.15575 type:complete len:111 (+) comp9840_c0_seq1:447-779(+)